MSKVQYHVVVAFGIGNDGAVTPVYERAARSIVEAVRLAIGLAGDYAGVIAFSRSMDKGRGWYGPAEVHEVRGEIPEDLQVLCHLKRRRPRAAVELRMAPAPLGRPKPSVSMSMVTTPPRWRR